ncbi:hypothetical protein Dimus_023244 [Dionaea muscipula]
MKRKKWSEHEEQTLLAKYSELQSSGALSKLKTREKKFKPIADHVNSVHHLQDPISYPFKWSWRDVSIKVQNMRHQYLGVKQKIRVSDTQFNWDDGENHWENFLKYKEVFGDVELEVKDKRWLDGDCGVEFFDGSRGFGVDGFGLGLGFEMDGDDLEDDEEMGVEEEEEEENHDHGSCGEDNNGDSGGRLKKRKLAFLETQVSELRDMMLRREERRREREGSMGKDQVMMRRGRAKESLKRDAEEEEEVEVEGKRREFELQKMWARRESERMLQWGKELAEERQWRMRMEERREEEEMQWRDRLIVMQIEHEKQMMQMHANACQNQLQILGAMARLINDALAAAAAAAAAALPAALPPQVLQSLQQQQQHTGGGGGGGALGDHGKPDANSPPEFL